MAEGNNVTLTQKVKEVERNKKTVINARSLNKSLKEKIYNLPGGVHDKQGLLLTAALNNSKQMVETSKEVLNTSKRELQEMLNESLNRSINKAAAAKEKSLNRSAASRSINRSMNRSMNRSKSAPESPARVTRKMDRMLDNPELYKMFYKRMPQDEEGIKEIKTYTEFIEQSKKDLAKLIEENRILRLKLEELERKFEGQGLWLNGGLNADYIKGKKEINELNDKIAKNQLILMDTQSYINSTYNNLFADYGVRRPKTQSNAPVTVPVPLSPQQMDVAGARISFSPTRAPSELQQMDITGAEIRLSPPRVPLSPQEMEGAGARIPSSPRRVPISPQQMDIAGAGINISPRRVPVSPQQMMDGAGARIPSSPYQLLSKSKHEMTDKVEDFQTLMFELEEKRITLNLAFEVLFKLRKYKENVDSQEAVRVLNRINKIRARTLKVEKDFKRIESNLKIVMKELSKYYDKLDRETQNLMRKQNKIFFKSSRIPKVSVPSQTRNRSTSQISAFEQEAKKNIENLTKLRNEHKKKMQECQSKIDGFKQQLNQTFDETEMTEELLKMKITNEQSIYDQNLQKLKKVSSILMEICMNILFRNKNVVYSQAFMDDVKKILAELRVDGVQTSRIAMAVKRPVIVARLPGFPSPVKQKITKRVYKKKLSSVLKRMKRALQE